MVAQRETVAVSSRSSFAIANLSDEEAASIGASRMDPRHDHLNALLNTELNFIHDFGLEAKL